MNPAELDPFSEDPEDQGPSPRNPHPRSNPDGSLPEHLRPDPGAKSRHYGFKGPDVTVSWRGALREFEENLWPVFREFGYDKGTALLAALTNELSNAVSVPNLSKALDAPRGPSEPFVAPGGLGNIGDRSTAVWDRSWVLATPGASLAPP